MGHRCWQSLPQTQISRGGGGSFSRGKHIVSCFDLETCSKSIEDGVNGQNTCHFLFVFCGNFGRISAPQSIFI